MCAPTPRWSRLTMSTSTSVRKVLTAPLALSHGMVRPPEDSSGPPPPFDLEALPTASHSPDRLKSWFRQAVEVRDSDGAERVLRTAIATGAPAAAVADLLFSAVTDHYFLDAGH